MIAKWIRRRDAVHRGIADPSGAIGDLPAPQARDDGRLTPYRFVSLIFRSLVVGLGTTLIGGIVLSSAIPFVAGLFRAPEFIALRGMGFVMAGVLGILLAVWFLFHALRQAREEA